MKTFTLTLAFICLAAVQAVAQFNATITVTDLGTGAPLANASVSLDGNFLSTDAAGQAVFTALADNTYDYSVSAPCYASGGGSVTIAGADAASSIALEAATTNSVFFFIGSPMAMLGVTVNLTNGLDYNETFVTSSPFGGDFLENVPYGDFFYTLSKPCFGTINGTVTVVCNNGDGIAVFENPVASTTNSVFFFIGSPMAMQGVTVNLTDGLGFNETFVTNSPFGGQSIDNVPYGDYFYTLSKPCFGTINGTVTVDCNNGDGIAVFAEPAAATTNSVFFFIGSPMAITGSTVNLTNGDDYFASFVTSSPFGGDFIEGVPYGEISYTITTPCYETVSGTVTVECNNGDGIAVFAEPAAATTNSVFFFIGSPMAIIGSTVDLTNGDDYFASFVTSSPFGGDFIEGVPYGEISYTITTPCYETVSGTVTVECNNGDGIAVFAEPVEVVLDLAISVDGATLTASANGVDYQWVDCDSGNEPIEGATAQSFSAPQDGSYAVIITSGNCSQTSDCLTVIGTAVSGIDGSMDLVVFPNPFQDVLTIRTRAQAGPVRVELFSTTGQLLINEMYTATELITLSTAQLAPGSYVLRLTEGSTRSTMSVVK